MAALDPVPSPKSQDHWVIECPGAAREASPLKNTVWPMTGVVCEATNVAVGAVDASTFTDWTDVAERPRSLVTVRLTVKVPVVEYEFVTVLPDAVPPSPNVHAYDVIAEAPGPGTLAEASNVERTFNCTGVGVIVNDAVGVDAGGRITPGGTSRIRADCEVAASEDPPVPPVVVATMSTHVPGSGGAPHVSNRPPAGLGGAVYTVKATPSPSVTRERAESVP